ncbi:GNAT family N-acetyltransferase [Leptospira sp. GIMC2001]|uniref:GNAT family N-acetyltransferase n=1 Tax=Leptospira sp. GIMC2001 TaxID=1513297 RepID=UPI00234A41E6|nr:GNAT family N-acetyltransferase [Leptospira sp. GIMC2001]WCL48611.1 GNAT family N-acetyltransferase [Leptospira sp. GIMC2001]
MPIVDLSAEDREEAIELVGQFFRKINSLDLDGLFQIRPRAATKFVDIYLKLAGTDKVVFRGFRTEDSELVSLIIARVEDKPFLVEEKTLYIDIAVTKNGRKKNGYMSLLIDSVSDWAKSNGIQSLELRAIAANQEAMDYWRSKGFQEFYVRFRKKLINE